MRRFLALWVFLPLAALFAYVALLIWRSEQPDNQRKDNL